MMMPTLLVLSFLMSAVSLTGPAPKAATATVEGTWTSAFQKHAARGVADEMWMQLRTDAQRRHSYSFHLPLGELGGLAIGPGHVGETDVRFSLQREAGRFDFRGHFRGDSGAGTFRFASDDGYVRDMAALGYRSIGRDQLFALAVFDVTTTFVQALRDLGYADLSLDHLFGLKIHGATLDFIRAMQTLRYRDVPVDDLLAMRIHGVDAAFAKSLEAP